MFTWAPSDMSEIDTKRVIHRLDIHLFSKPLAQRKWKFNVEKRDVINEEVGKLSDVKFIIKTKYSTWLANVVLVREVKNKWHMCVDFTNLNTACPKDLYPLSDIDLLIEGSSGYCMLSFMDAYMGYNRIWMDPHPKEASFRIMITTTITMACLSALRTVVPPTSDSWMLSSPTK